MGGGGSKTNTIQSLSFWVWHYFYFYHFKVINSIAGECPIGSMVGIQGILAWLRRLSEEMWSVTEWNVFPTWKLSPSFLGLDLLWELYTACLFVPRHYVSIYAVSPGNWHPLHSDDEATWELLSQKEWAGFKTKAISLPRMMKGRKQQKVNISVNTYLVEYLIDFTGGVSKKDI